MASSASGEVPELQDEYPMENNYQWLHGRVDAGIDKNLSLLEPVPVQMPEMEELQQRNYIGTSRQGTPFEKSILASEVVKSTSTCFIAKLPSELLDYILSLLGPFDFVRASSTCRRFKIHGQSDSAWQRHVQDNVPGARVTSPYPCKTFRELYISHDPHWFLPKYKIWFNDFHLSGKLMLARYDPRRGCIEGYQLIAERDAPSFDPWEVDDEVLIHSFNPKIRLHKDLPVLQLDTQSSAEAIPPWLSRRAQNQFHPETMMKIGGKSRFQSNFSSFSLTMPVSPRPGLSVWPPSTIPARHRVANPSPQQRLGNDVFKPQRRSEASNQAFKINTWFNMGAMTTSGIRVGQESFTYATLDPKLYTPTEEKPFRGIWVGDYSGHGCEFLLLNQPDNETPFDEASVIQRDDETSEEFEIRKREERIYRGSLEAIKLTGDPNIPRGEYTFIADDISSKGFVRTATESRFKGARIVHSRGHIAARMFRNDKYIESQLIMVSHDRLAQYWVGFGHISFYERVDIDEHLDPRADQFPSAK